MNTVLIVLGVIFLVIVAVVAAGVVFAVTIRLRQNRQLDRQAAEQQDYPEWAAEHDLTYDPEDPVLQNAGLGQVMPFRDFNGPGVLFRTNHVFHGEFVGRPGYLLGLALFADPRPGAKPSATYTVALARLDPPAPELALGQGKRGKRRDAGSVRTGDAAFDARFVVTAADQRAALDLLQAPLMTWLSEQPRQGMPSMHLNGGWACCYLRGPFLIERAERVRDQLERLLASRDGQASA
ncbi:hypothetical protein GCM10027160_03020 [Streptomyces calidiresistens]|uniref:Uncharacterized protein n=1 Tax=Streptomyces calidiresistens TaxID=1485586 RepID=A0A7W3T4A7_9ACTN|nr:hypothetical protein [Streptomyces calidiresistens]MBB0230667.1 hypothetical protein [Streptomyces calidiresistens]